MAKSTMEIENGMVVDGEWSEDDERIVGECEECGELIYSDAYHLEGPQNVLFCCKDCALEYYGVTEVEDI